MVVTFMAFVCNIILLCRVDFPVQFLFSIIFVYVGAELALMYYIFRFLHERRERIANAEAEEKKIIKELAS
jgi:fucose permease